MMSIFIFIEQRNHLRNFFRELLSAPKGFKKWINICRYDEKNLSYRTEKKFFQIAWPTETNKNRCIITLVFFCFCVRTLCKTQLFSSSINRSGSLLSQSQHIRNKD